MTEKIKLSKAAKEIISNKNKEIKRLTNELENQKSLKKVYRSNCSKHLKKIISLENDIKDKELYRKAFSVLLAAVDERRLAWSLSKEYDRQKLSYDLNQDLHTFTKNNFDNIKKDINKNKSSKGLSINLENIFKDFGLNKK